MWTPWVSGRVRQSRDGAAGVLECQLNAATLEPVSEAGEVPLGGGATTGCVVRVGDTVRRPAGPASRLMRDVLLRLEKAGFDEAPRWLGLDDRGRDVLTWIEGETFVERGRMHPYLDDSAGRVLFSGKQVCAALSLLRRYHDALAGDVVCHGDFGPWNVVWAQGLPRALIDFDGVYRGDPADDVAYALRMFIGYGRTESEPPDLVERTRAALGAYGTGFDVPAILEREYERAVDRCRKNGWSRQLAVIPLEREWLAANRALFRGEERRVRDRSRVSRSAGEAMMEQQARRPPPKESR
jgi:hypothetical protein